MTVQTISSGVTSSGLSVTSGNALSVLSGGVVVETSLLSGATMTAAAGALAVNVTVAGGASLLGAGEVEGQIAVRGTVSGVSLAGSSGDSSIMSIRSGGRALGVAVNSGGVEVVFAHGVASGDVVGDGGVQRVSSGGVVSASTVDSGGLLAVHSQGRSIGSIVRSAGLEVVSSLGLATGAWVVSSAGALRVLGDVLSGKVARGGMETILSGGFADFGVMSGDEFVYGDVFSTSIGSGGSQSVEAGGKAFDLRVGSGGTVVVSAGGYIGESAYETEIAAGGVLRIKSGGSGYAIEVNGHATILSGGVATATDVGVGGYEFDYGLTSAPQVGGTLLVAAGGAVSGELLLLEGGRAIISGTMSSGEVADFYAPRGTLELENLAGFHAAISGFNTSGQRIDLGGLAFASGSETITWAQSGASGTLTVTDGAKVAALTLVGTYVASNFQLGDDGHGGTVITEPKRPAMTPNSPAINHFAEAMAGLRGGRDQAFVVHSGGTALSNAPPLVTAATSGR